jgi:hypothetical protein
MRVRFSKHRVFITSQWRMGASPLEHWGWAIDHNIFAKRILNTIVCI